MASRKLIDYLPPYMQNYLEINKITDAEQPQIDFLWSLIDIIFDNQFIDSATEYGVYRWEKILGISPKPTDTLSERKSRILMFLNKRIPYTLTVLNNVLTELCGRNGYEINLNANEYLIEIKLALSNANIFDDVASTVKKMIPANMVCTVSIMYNTHNMLSVYTHEAMAGYSHDQLRKEVF